MPAGCEEEKVESTKSCKREGLSKQPAAALVNFWGHLCNKVETFKQPSVSTKVKELVDKLSQPKSVRQIKN